MTPPLVTPDTRAIMATQIYTTWIAGGRNPETRRELDQLMSDAVTHADMMIAQLEFEKSHSWMVVELEDELLEWLETTAAERKITLHKLIEEVVGAFLRKLEAIKDDPEALAALQESLARKPAQKPGITSK